LEPIYHPELINSADLASIGWGGDGRYSGDMLEQRAGSTRIHVEEGDFRNLPDAFIKSHCPHCGQEHQWKPSQARLVDGLPPGRWVKTTSRSQ
jgi:hypothetical protein